MDESSGKIERVEERIEFPSTPEVIGAREQNPVFQGIAGARGYVQNGDRGDGSFHDKYYRPERLKYSHEAMVDLIIEKPELNHNQIAAVFGYTPQWVGRIINSDAFQAYLATRRQEVVDPFLVASLEEKFRGLADRSMEILSEKLEATKSADLAVKGLELSIKALGFGARDRGGVVNNNFVVALPGKAPSSADWASSHGGGVLIDAQPVQSTRSMAVRDPLKQPKTMTPAEE